jgi:hypothetical protein
MKFKASSSVDFEIAPAGNHVAFCTGIVDIGMQPGRGKYPQPRHEVYVRFELCNERIKYQRDGKEVEGPMSIGRTFTASMSEKANLRKFVEGLYGKPFPSDDVAEGFDFQALLGLQCLLNITHSERGGKRYANVMGAAPLPKGMPVTGKQENPSLFFDLENPSADVFDQLPKWLKEKVTGRIKNDTPEPARRPIPPVFPEFDDSIPF